MSERIRYHAELRDKLRKEDVTLIAFGFENKTTSAEIFAPIDSELAKRLLLFITIATRPTPKRTPQQAFKEAFEK